MAGREPDSRDASAFLAEALPVRQHRAAASISQLDRRAEERSAARPAVRQDSVSRVDAADSLLPWERPARWSPPEGQRAAAWDAAPAYWEANRLAWVRADVLTKVREENRLETTRVPPEMLRAKAGADLKEFALAGGPAERGGPESECREAERAVR